MSTSQSTWRNVVGAGAAGAFAVAAAAQLQRYRWQAKRRAAKRSAPELPEDADLLRVGYAKRKVPSDVDHIVVGSGLSGLYLAALLAKLGRRVLVLEQHYVAGGCTHTFRDQGFEFDTGVHYIGQATQLTALMDFAAGREGAFRMQRSGVKDGSNVYNEIQVGDRTHTFRPGKENFIGDLVAKFPQEEAHIRAFFREVKFGVLALTLVSTKQLMPRFAWAALVAAPGPARWLVDRYVKRTLSNVLDDCGVRDEQLRSFLAAEFGDYGVVPDEVPFFLHATILFHYIWEGGFYPEGGSDAFVEALVPGIFEAGGSVLVRAPVSKILLEDGRAVGVEVKGKDVIRAKCSVVSAAGAEATYTKLLDEVSVEKMGGLPESVREAERGGVAHHVYAFVGLDGASKDLGLPTHNIWSFPTAGSVETPNLTSVWRSMTETRGRPPAYLESDEAAAEAKLPCFMSFPSAKDEKYDARCPGKSTAVIITESRAEYFGPPGAHGKRGAEYQQIKERYKTAVLNGFCRHFPGLKSRVSYVDIGTPASNEFYLGRRGSYGLTQSIARFLDPALRMVPKASRGLYLTGQDFLCCGVFAQPIVAVFALSKVLGVMSLDFWLLLADLVWAVVKRSLFNPGETHPGLRELLRWVW